MNVKNWKFFAMAVFIALFGMMLFFSYGSKDQNMWFSLALGGLMVGFWLFELIPIYLTALFPFVFGIPLGIMTKSDLASSFGNTNVYLFFGGFMLALALEKHDVHIQIAKRIIRALGNSKPRLLLGFLLATALLSMWISNTATALMMLPMALAVIATLPKKHKDSKFPVFLLLAIAYGASIGGMATLVGSPPNLQMAGILDSETYGIKVDFLQWMKIGMPVCFIMLGLTYAFFYFMMGEERKQHIDSFDLTLQPWTKNQKWVLGVFGVVVLVWSFKPILENWWGFTIEDFGPAILASILLFIIPSETKGPLLHWEDTAKLPWGILILFGGGISLATMFETNGVILALSNTFSNYAELGVFVVMLVLVTISVFATELMSNLALVTVLIPIVAQFALNSRFDVLQLAIPVALGASCAFMLPVGTPPNAIVFSSGELKISQMARYGFVLNIIAVLTIALYSALFL